MAVKEIKIVPGTTNFPIDLKLFLIIRLYIHLMYYFAASQLVTFLKNSFIN